MSEHVVQRFGPEYYCDEPGVFDRLPKILESRRGNMSCWFTGIDRGMR
ncbi:hypothetical protein NIE88_15235 [Sporolactobacillus shoreicorticis]|uniref:Uncharacterized protein n=1 Tax=Sporolactobacillus shoreicorticis TaxID=1923877 RepID=A0ABW5S651_9BACL|nr:hypothetical protein [Sporolactobacillus shoreicorticis]MCO7127123.1 hypothetical protein [Sporolactobacillus shoreicorticis]